MLCVNVNNIKQMAILLKTTAYLISTKDDTIYKESLFYTVDFYDP